MLIPDVFEKHKYEPKGIIHIGAHMCEERDIYARAGCGDDKVLWIEGNPRIADQVRQRLPSTVNIASAIISNAPGTVKFNISSNGQSSSYRDLALHAVYHPDVTYVDQMELPAYTLPQFLDIRGESIAKYDTLIMDIQGAEYDVLLGAENFLKLGYFRAIYMEVNTGEVYKGCGLLEDIKILLEKYSYNLVDINMTAYQWGDAFFVRSVTVTNK